MLANDLYRQVHGCLNGVTMYNLSCCLVVAARDDPSAARAMLNHAAPTSNASFGGLLLEADDSQVVERSLDLASRWLFQAAATNFCKDVNARSDPDLSLLRERKPELFERAMQIISLMKVPT